MELKSATQGRHSGRWPVVLVLLQYGGYFSLRDSEHDDDDPPLYIHTNIFFSEFRSGQFCQYSVGLEERTVIARSPTVPTLPDFLGRPTRLDRQPQRTSIPNSPGKYRAHHKH
jgi:hypothetical protein